MSQTPADTDRVDENTGTPEPAPAAADELNRAAVASVKAVDADPAELAADSADPEPAEQRERRRRTPDHDQLVAEGDAAGDYLERLLDILDYDGDIDLDVEGERAVVSIIGSDSGDPDADADDSGDIARLVGDRGEVLDALQELTRLAATAETGQRSRLMLDVAGYRAQRRAELAEFGTSTAERVRQSGEQQRLEPMNAFERKIVHDAVAAVDGITSWSEGEEPRRRVVIGVEQTADTGDATAEDAADDGQG